MTHDLNAPGAAQARNQGIDALRGISILLVVLHHVGLRVPLTKTALGGHAVDWLLEGLNYNGSEAVFVFFVISGFLITRRVQERSGELRRISLRDFYGRRAARIVPCLVALVFVLSVFHGLSVPQYVIRKDGQSLGGAVLSAFGFYLNWYEGQHGYLPGGWDVLWSLSIEEVFYLGFPIVCLVLRRDRWMVPALLVLAVSLPFTHAALNGRDIWQEKAYLPGMSAIACGVLTAIAAKRFPNPPRWFPTAACLLGATGITCIVFAGGVVWKLIGEGYLLVLTVSSSSLVIGLHFRESMRPLGKVALLSGLRSFGRLSYEIYLTHMFCVLAVVGIAKASGVDLAWGFLWYVPAVALSWILGALVARYFSTPVDRRLRAWLTRPTVANLGEFEVAKDVAGSAKAP